MTLFYVAGGGRRGEIIVLKLTFLIDVLSSFFAHTKIV